MADQGSEFYNNSFLKWLEDKRWMQHGCVKPREILQLNISV